MDMSSTGRQFGVLHLIGKDRTGILQEASAFVSDRGGTIEEGISHTLSTEAIVILYVSGSSKQLNMIEQESSKLGETLQLISLFSRINDKQAVTDRDTLPLTLRISSPDFAGLVASITLFFTRHSLDIVEHHTHKSPLPGTQGLFTYRHKFTVLLPPEFKRKAFIAELDQLAMDQKFIRDDISHSDFY